MIGEIIELLREGEILHESFEDKGYCEEIFMSSVQDFASELNVKCKFLFTSSAKSFRKYGGENGFPVSR